MDTTDIPNKRYMRPLLWTCLILLLFAILGLLQHYPLAELIDHDAVAGLVMRLGIFGILGFVLIGALVTAVGLPRQLVAFIGGYTFGVTGGVVLGTLAAIGGCAICFSLSRRFFRRPVESRFSKMVSFLNRLLRDDPSLKIIVLRLQPFGTNLATNLAAGVTQLPARVFIVSSLLGYLPQMLVFALTGSGVRVQSSTQVMISAVLFGLSVVLGLYLYRRHIAQAAAE